MDILTKHLSSEFLLDFCRNNTITIAVFLAVFYLTWKLLTRQRRLPPGPVGVPILGYLPFVGKDIGVAGAELGKKYNTNIVSFKILHQRFTLLNTYELVKEYMLKKDNLTDRPVDSNLSLFHTGHEGLLISSGKLWKEHRRFSLSVLRDFGMGKMTVEEKVTDELEGTWKEMEETKGLAFNPQDLAMGAASNIVCNIIFGERFDYKDPAFIKYLRAINGMANTGSGNGDRLPDILFSWMRYIPFDIFGFHVAQAHFDTITNFTNEQIAKHKAELQPGHVKDYIDAYLLKREEENELNSSFTDFQLSCEIIDLFFAGTETTSTTLRWCIYYMVEYPEIQEKVQEEIDSKIGRNRLPTMKDKLLLPYTEAVLMEIQRAATILTIGVPHTNENEDIEIESYVIPKATRVVANVYAIHHDTNIWPDPHNFNPANFLDDNGKLRNQDRLIPFLIGRRSCIGEALAKMELFLFFTGWLQKFTIRCPKGQTMPEGKRWSIIKQPKDYEVCFIPR